MVVSLWGPELQQVCIYLNVTDTRVNVITIHSVQGQFVGLKCSNLMCEGRFWSVQHAEGKQTWGPWLGVRHTEVLKKGGGGGGGALLIWLQKEPGSDPPEHLKDELFSKSVKQVWCRLSVWFEAQKSKKKDKVAAAAARRLHSWERSFLLPAVEGKTVKTSAGGWRGRGVKILSSFTLNLRVGAPDGCTLWWFWSFSRVEI